MGVGGAPGVVVPADCWQAARPSGAFALASCSVGPGFDFADFGFLRGHKSLANAGFAAGNNLGIRRALERGAADAFETDVDEVVCVISATEEHSQANMRRSRADACTTSWANSTWAN